MNHYESYIYGTIQGFLMFFVFLYESISLVMIILGVQVRDLHPAKRRGSRRRRGQGAGHEDPGSREEGSW